MSVKEQKTEKSEASEHFKIAEKQMKDMEEASRLAKQRLEATLRLVNQRRAKYLTKPVN